MTTDIKEGMPADGIMERDTLENDIQMKDFTKQITTERDMLWIDMVVANAQILVGNILVHPDLWVLILVLIIPTIVAPSGVEKWIFDADTRDILEIGTRVRWSGALIEVTLETTTCIVVASHIPIGTMVGVETVMIAVKDSMTIEIAGGKGIEDHSRVLLNVHLTQALPIWSNKATIYFNDPVLSSISSSIVTFSSAEVTVRRHRQ